MRLALTLLVPWQIAALRLNCEPRGLDFLMSDYTPIFQSLDYADDRTLEALPAIVTEQLPAVAFYAYWMLNLSPEHCKSLYKRFSNRPELHRWMLPLMLILKNPTLSEIVDWPSYQHDTFFISGNPAALKEEPWNTRIVKAVMENPALLESCPPVIADSVPSWFNPYLLYSATLFQEWRAKLPPLLYLVQLFTSGPVRSSSQLVTPHTEEVISFYNFRSNPTDEEKFAIVLKHIMSHVEMERDSVKAIWHGKLVHLGLTISTDLPLSIILNYFNAYATKDYQYGMVQLLACKIFLHHSLPESIPRHIASKLNRLKTRFPSMQPFWGLRPVYTRHWRRDLISSGVFAPPLQACNLQDACLVLSNICKSVFWLIHPTFESPFLVQHSEQIVSCEDLYCLLNMIPPLFVADGVIENTLNGAIFSTVQQSPVVWLTVSLLISWGYIYNDRDLFAFSDGQWQLIYDLAASSVFTESVHEGLAIVVKSLVSHGFFRATHYRYIR